MNRNYFCAVLSLFLLQACTTAQEQELDKKVAELSNCEKIDALVAGHGRGFPYLRTTQTTSKYMDTWKARYHLVGDSCQVWGWGDQKFSYVCSLTEPNQAVAMEHFDKAKKITSDCLGEGWTLKQGARKQGEGIRADYSTPGNNTVITLLAASSPTLFATEWKTYFFVGDPADLK